MPARIPGEGKLKVIEAAPGAYARMRADGKVTAVATVLARSGTTQEEHDERSLAVLVAASAAGARRARRAGKRALTAASCGASR